MSPSRGSRGHPSPSPAMLMPPAPLPPPPTPVMLYIGAGYDLSPLLTFAPGGPPYPIVPLTHDHTHPHVAPPHESYTSFLFVDAKPRHTSAFMVPDFDEWTSVAARARNVLHYAQGSLDRWCTVPGAPDLLWFEGGGDAALLQQRRLEGWVVPEPQSHPTPAPHRPLTTLLYLFNTLDIELARTPALDNIWPRVAALYVHGLRLHVRTGAGVGGVGGRMIGVGGEAVPASLMDKGLGAGLKRCYVIVGSWGTPRGREGVRHVDFVRAARRLVTTSTPVPALHRLPVRSASTPSSSATTTPSSSSSSLSLSLSPLVFRRRRPTTAPSQSQSHAHPHHAHAPAVRSFPRTASDDGFSGAGGGGCTSEEEEEGGGWDWDSADEYTDDEPSPPPPPHPTPQQRTAKFPEDAAPAPFHTPIPQLAWSPTLRGGVGGYYVAMSVGESGAVWRARARARARRGGGGEVGAEGEEGDESGEEEVGTSPVQPRVQPHQEPQHLRTRTDAPVRLRLRPRAPTPAHRSRSLSPSTSDEEEESGGEEGGGKTRMGRKARGKGKGRPFWGVGFFGGGARTRWTGEEEEHGEGARPISAPCKHRERERRMDVFDFLSATAGEGEVLTAPGEEEGFTPGSGSFVGTPSSSFHLTPLSSRSSRSFPTSHTHTLPRPTTAPAPTPSTLDGRRFTLGLRRTRGGTETRAKRGDRGGVVGFLRAREGEGWGDGDGDGSFLATPPSGSFLASHPRSSSRPATAPTPFAHTEKRSTSGTGKPRGTGKEKRTRGRSLSISAFLGWRHASPAPLTPDAQTCSAVPVSPPPLALSKPPHRRAHSHSQAKARFSDAPPVPLLPLHVRHGHPPAPYVLTHTHVPIRRPHTT